MFYIIFCFCPLVFFGSNRRKREGGWGTYKGDEELDISGSCPPLFCSLCCCCCCCWLLASIVCWRCSNNNIVLYVFSSFWRVTKCIQYIYKYTVGWITPDRMTASRWMLWYSGPVICRHPIPICHCCVVCVCVFFNEIEIRVKRKWIYIKKSYSLNFKA